VRKARTSATFADGTKKKRLAVLNLADVDKPDRPRLERRSSLSGATTASAAFATRVFRNSLAERTTGPNADGAGKLNRWGSLLRRHRQSLDDAEPAAPRAPGEAEPASPTSPPSPNKDPRRLVRAQSMPSIVPGILNVPGDVPTAADDAAAPTLARSATTATAPQHHSGAAAGGAPGSPSKEKGGAKEPSPGSSTAWDKIVHARLSNKTTSISTKVRRCRSSLSNPC